MKKILLFFLLVISVHAQSQKTVTPNWVKSVAQDTATALRAEIALKMNSSAFADSFKNRFSATSIAAIKEVAEYEPVIADSSILLYSGGVWSIFDLSEALSATANNAINITYPDANTISFNDTNVLLLDPATLEIQTGILTVVGGTGSGGIQDTVLYKGRNVPVDSLVLLADIQGDTSDYTVTEMDSILANAKMKWDTTASTGYVTQYDLTQVSWDSTYAYQRITALESTVTSLQNSINNILAALDTCGCSASTADNTPPLAPTSYVAIGGTSQTQYVTTWTDPVASDLDSIRWYEGSSNDTTAMTWITSIAAGTETYTRTGRTANTTYWSAIKAVDDSGNVSYFSNVDSATTLPTGGVTPVATLDFEEGNLSEWSSTSGANLSASTTFAHKGTYSMRVGTNSYGIFNFTSDTEVWLTFWIYLPSTSSQSASYNYISMFDNGIADRTVFATNQNGGSTWEEWLVGVNSGNMTDNDYKTNFSQDTWHKVKIYYQTNGTTTSQHQVWVDDTSIWSTTAAYVNSVSNFTVGSEAATITNYFYIDDIKLYTSDPGTQD